MLWRRSVRAAVLPALTIATALLAAAGVTYAVVRHLPHPVAAATGHPPITPGQPAPPYGGTGPGPGRPGSGQVPGVAPSSRSRPPGTGPAHGGSPRRPGPAQTPKGAPGAGVRPGTGKQAPSRGSEQAELAGVSAVLERSAASRAAVVGAARGVVSCTLAPAPGLTDVTSAMAARQDQLDQTLALPVSAIPAGGQLRIRLAAALRLSLAADRRLARWMNQAMQAGGCPSAPLESDSYLSALRASALATAGKQRFLRLWDPLAARFGQPVYTRRQI